MATSSPGTRFIKLLAELRKLTSQSTEVVASLQAECNESKIRRVTVEILDAAEKVSKLAELLDPVMLPTQVFDLSDPRTTGVVIGQVVEGIQAKGLKDIVAFYGSGVYAIYYRGDVIPYRAISDTGCPIYVGKAGPADPQAKNPRAQGVRLFTRLKEHRKTIERASNLQIEDFLVRYLVVQSGWEKAAEEYLIRRFEPAWNNEMKVCSGFGKHGDKKREELSPWDVLHPGRGWASTQTSLKGRTSEDVARLIESHFIDLLARDRERWENVFSKSWLKSRKS